MHADEPLSGGTHVFLLFWIRCFHMDVSGMHLSQEDADPHHRWRHWVTLSLPHIPLSVAESCNQTFHQPASRSLDNIFYNAVALLCSKSLHMDNWVVLLSGATELLVLTTEWCHWVTGTHDRVVPLSGPSVSTLHASWASSLLTLQLWAFEATLWPA